MSKRFRFLIILVLVALGVLFLSPTIKWYGGISADKKMLAERSNFQIRDYALKQADKVYLNLRKSIMKEFDATSIKNGAGLLEKLSKADNPVSQLIKERLSDGGKNLVEGYKSGTKLSDADNELLVKELNTLVEGDLFYNPDDFVDIPLLEMTKGMADSAYKNGDIKGASLKVLNRFLLEESFPANLSPVLVDEAYTFLEEPVTDYMKSIKRKVPSPLPAKYVFAAFPTTSELTRVIEKHFSNQIYDLKSVRDDAVLLGLDLQGGLQVTIKADFEAFDEEKGVTSTSDERKELLEKKVIPVLSDRIDKYGVTEPQIRLQANDRILIQMPGMADPDRIKTFIMGKGRLKFNIVDREGQAAFDEYYTKYREEGIGADGLPKDPSVLPAGTTLMEYVEKDEYNLDRKVGYTVLKTGEEYVFDGEYVTSASTYQSSVNLSQTVNFELSPQGQELFYNLTKDNVNETLAVVLDDKVKFKANIRSPIRGNVMVEGSITLQEAEDLAKTLESGSLPVPLIIEEQQAVGATLGEDAINAGLKAIMLGFILVMAFMLVYYRGGGVVADIALLLNFFFMGAALSVFNFTLTLPSIASFILTVGMAVDANVIIFERIKEEYKIGKSRKAAITTGFSKAFWTIVDANITTLIAAVSLAQFGRGPIQGFAVVLVIGIFCSMFTALFVARFLFDFVTDVFQASKLSLVWGGKK